MALRFKSCLPSFNPQFPQTNAQLSQTSRSVKPTSLPTANKWSIAQENNSIPFKNQDDMQINHAEKLKVLKQVLRKVGENSSECVHMIDALQRLNLDYHFQEEIDAFLKGQDVVYCTDYGGGCGHNLHETTLRFRLLRQHGYYAPTDVFDRLTNKEGKFNLKLSEDIKGMMGLYEASQLSIAGEDILDEAAIFSGKVLKDKAAYLDFHEAKLVRSTLEQPFHKSLAMFTSRNLIDDFHGKNGWLNALQEVAKLDFTLLQLIHQNEILQISKWWTDLGLGNELKYARNQPLKWYIWSLACLSDPSLSDLRIELTRPISFIYLLDDIFDVYGTIDELTLFTEAVTRWDINANEQLPEHMKSCFKALYDLTNEISYKVYKEHGWNPIDSLRKSWASLCKAFLVEAEWFASGKLPEAEEYLKNGTVSSGVHIVLVHIFFLLGHGITPEKVRVLDRMPAIISSPATILRLWDDLGSAEDENQEGNDGSYLQCFLKDHADCSLKRAREEVMRKISDAWKSLNEGCLFQKSFPKAFTKASLNLARMVPLMYSYDDNHCLPKLEDQVKSLLYDAVP